MPTMMMGSKRTQWTQPDADAFLEWEPNAATKEVPLDLLMVIQQIELAEAQRAVEARKKK